MRVRTALHARHFTDIPGGEITVWLPRRRIDRRREDWARPVARFFQTSTSTPVWVVSATSNRRLQSSTAHRCERRVYHVHHQKYHHHHQQQHGTAHTGSTSTATSPRWYQHNSVLLQPGVRLGNWTHCICIPWYFNIVTSQTRTRDRGRTTTPVPAAIISCCAYNVGGNQVRDCNGRTYFIACTGRHSKTMGRR